ncbi:MAG: hypothetical protein PHO63_02810 [Bacilli bacterium]|nr:hypothetical protein [Bacilli bacterium]MDD4808759.1 hypothetical protein [Bacilli bacterium]
MNNDIKNFIKLQEVLNTKRDKLESSLSSGFYTKVQYNDILRKIEIEQQNLYKTSLKAAKDLIKEQLDIDFSSYIQTDGYDTKFKKITTLEFKTPEDIKKDIKEIKLMYKESNLNNEEVLVAIKILEEYYLNK